MPAIPRITKVATVAQLAEVLACDGTELRFDVRAETPEIRDGGTWRPLGTAREWPYLVDRLLTRHGAKVPDPNGPGGRSLWAAFFYEREHDPFADWLNEAADKYPDGEAFDPGKLPAMIWGDRLTGPPGDAALREWKWRVIFLAAVGRTLAPPQRFDLLPILQSDKGGTGKTLVSTNLVPHRWTDSGWPLSDVAGHDAARKMAERSEGMVFLVADEMAGYSASEREALKAFLSLAADRSTRKYDRNATTVPRRWVLMASTNDRTPIPYDPSGGRRYIVTGIGGDRLTDGESANILEWLITHRAGYWAWAVHRFRAICEAEGEFSGRHLTLPEELYPAHEQHLEHWQWNPDRDGRAGWGASADARMPDPPEPAGLPANLRSTDVPLGSWQAEGKRVTEAF